MPWLSQGEVNLDFTRRASYTVPVTAKLTDRFLAYLIDTIPFWIGYYLTRDSFPGPGAAPALVWLAAYVLYHAVSNAFGATIGKRLLGLRVANAQGAPLSPGRSLLRALAVVLSTPLFNFGFLWAFFDRESRALHDVIASSRVIDAAPKSEKRSLIAGALASLSLAGALTIIIYTAFFRATPEDLAAVERARRGLRILAQLEEQYKAAHGQYTNQLSDLAEASGDVGEFVRSMGEIFEPSQFQIKAGHSRFLLRARAKDRRRTVVSLSSR